MKAAFVGGPSAVLVRDAGQLSPGPGEILVRMEACGICGSDVEKVFGSYSKPSTRLGHEPAGTVIAAGAGAGFSAGDRVFTHHHVACGQCHLCMRGDLTLCSKYAESNLEPCGLAQEYIVPAWNVSHGGVLRLPDSMSFEEAAMIEPLACCVRAWSRVRHHDGDAVAVFGAGSTGMMHAMLARHYGAGCVICTDTNQFRLDFATKSGAADHAIAAGEQCAGKVASAAFGRGADVSIVATGSIAALQSAIASTRRGGTVMMFGVPSSGATLELDMAGAYGAGLSLLTSYAASDEDTRAALHLLESKKVDAASLITHRYPISQAQAAFEQARQGGESMKIIVSGTLS